MSASKPWASAPKQALMHQKRGKLTKNSLSVSPYEHSSINSRLGGDCAGHPYVLYNTVSGISGLE